MTPQACPCGIHPADCSYHREAYQRHQEHPFWGLRAWLSEAERAEVDVLVKRIQEGHALVGGQKP